MRATERLCNVFVRATRAERREGLKTLPYKTIGSLKSKARR